MVDVRKQIKVGLIGILISIGLVLPIADAGPVSVEVGGIPNLPGLAVGAGTAASPSLSFSADLDTGEYNSAANEWSVSTGGAQAIKVDATKTLTALAASGAPGLALGTDGACLKVGSDAFISRTALNTLSFASTCAGNAAYINTPSGEVTAVDYRASAASGSVGFSLLNAGARLDLGSGANDYLDSDGTSARAGGGAGNFVAGTFYTNNGILRMYPSNKTAQVIGSINNAAGSVGVKLDNETALGTGTDRFSAAALNNGVYVGAITTGGAYVTAQSDGGIAAGDYAPVVHNGNQTTPQAIEHGSQALTGGTATVTFGTAFAAAPNCFCSDSSAVAACDATGASTTAVTLNGTGTDTIKWLCIGQR